MLLKRKSVNPVCLISVLCRGTIRCSWLVLRKKDKNSDKALFGTIVSFILNDLHIKKYVLAL